MIFAKTYYKTHNKKLLANIKTFKMLKHYLKDYKFEILILTEYKKLWRFINIKNLSS